MMKSSFKHSDCKVHTQNLGETFSVKHVLKLRNSMCRWEQPAMCVCARVRECGCVMCMRAYMLPYLCAYLCWNTHKHASTFKSHLLLLKVQITYMEFLKIHLTSNSKHFSKHLCALPLRTDYCYLFILCFRADRGSIQRVSSPAQACTLSSSLLAACNNINLNAKQTSIWWCWKKLLSPFCQIVTVLVATSKQTSRCPSLRSPSGCDPKCFKPGGHLDVSGWPRDPPLRRNTT